jgi:hypothetical protein
VPNFIVPAKFKITNGTALIDLAKHEALIMEWFENKLLELKRIYQGSQYEITKASFNEHCLNKGPTLSVI